MRNFDKTRSTRLEVNLDNIRYNCKLLKEHIKDAKWICVVKADYYGAGIRHTWHILEECGADMFAVATINEAIQLRKLGSRLPILILGHTTWDQYEDLIKYDLIPNIYNLEDAKELSNQAQAKNAKCQIHLSLDTGMSRLGFMPNDQAISDIVEISKLDGVEIGGIFTHYFGSDEKDPEPSIKQAQTFLDFCSKVEDQGVDLGIKHISNSAGVVTMKDYHLDAVRSAFISLGYYDDPWLEDLIKLRPSLELKTNITRIAKLPKGTSISYNAKYTTSKDETLIATLPIGYADGYPRTLSNKGKVYINGKLAPIRGTICMDQMMVEIEDEDVQVGDEAILFGYTPGVPSLEDVGEWAGTINSGISTTISKRVPRVYFENGKIKSVDDFLINT